MRKPAFGIFENKEADQLCGNRTADQHLCLRYISITIPVPPKSEFQASNDLLWLYSPVCVGPGQKPQGQVFLMIRLMFLSAYEEETCLIPCPVDCIMSDWSPWSDCSTSCETGTQMRYRHIKQIPSDGGRLCPALDQANKV